ncbi:MAG: acetyl-CoA hydrolase [Puniceicoccales bacterium]|jgi:succinate CoA transferase|nr:acetyl-CoA hydrolase [Puniceicoccales bacterium]
MSVEKIFPEEAASVVRNGDTVAFSGFTPAGCPKVVPHHIAMRAVREHEFGREFKINILSGASTCDAIDGELSRADAVLSKFPYQTDSTMRSGINHGKIRYCDLHISQCAQYLCDGLLGKIDVAIVEAADVLNGCELVLTTGVGLTPLFCKLADKIIIELNGYHGSKIFGLHDIYDVGKFGYRKHIPIFSPGDRIGEKIVKIDKAKVIGIVETNIPDSNFALSEFSLETNQIGQNVANFLIGEMHTGRIPVQFLPLQSGVGSIANSVLRAINECGDIPNYAMYSEVLQDAAIDGIKSDKILFGSACALSVTNGCLHEIYDNYDFFSKRLLLRPMNIANNSEVIGRLGLISVNTALEADLFGNVNSTHVFGKDIVNGIGGAADFSRNAYLSIFTCKSTAKNGCLSTIIPMCTHIDHSEHSVKILVTEYGVADLRAKTPIERANAIIDNCVHPEYRDVLRKFLSFGGKSHEPVDIFKAYNMHRAFQQCGDMRMVEW